MRSRWNFAIAALILLGIVMWQGPAQYRAWEYAHTPAPLSYRNLPLPAHGPVHAGQAIPLTVMRCNAEPHRLRYTFARNLVNAKTGELYALPSGDTFVDPGCRTIPSNLNVVPLGVPAGHYYIDGISEVDGEYGHYVVSWRSAEFDVAS